MSNILNEFKSYLETQDVSPQTVKGYLADLRQFKGWFEKTNSETLTLQRITPTDVKGYKHFLLKTERLKASTVNRRLAALSALARWARRTGQIQGDPTEHIKSVPTVPPGPKWLDKKEQYDLFRAIEDDLTVARDRYTKRQVTRRRDASMILFLLNTGLRLSELVGLRMNDLQLSEGKGSVLVQQGKGGKQRSVPLNHEAREALRAWMAVRPGSDYLWTSVEDSQPGALSGRTVQRILQRYAEAAEINELTPQICRHTFAKNLVDNDVSLEKVAALLGHSNLNTTRIYITHRVYDLELAVEGLSDY